ncbi:MAG: GNAT family N-acetyltransferase, partial [Kofleriaceae bacterium]
MSIEIRSIEPRELAAYHEAVFATFGQDAAEVDPDGARRIGALIPPTQLWAAFDGASIVATAGAFDLQLGLPGGGALPTSGLTAVTVRPTHRRRGLLRRLIDVHLEDARRRGLPASALWASEAGIYRRFGYGLAAESDAMSISQASTLGFLAPHDPDALEMIDEARARELLPGIYERAIAQRPGALRRDDVWWRERRFLENGHTRQGASRRRHVVARRGDQLVGYVVYRQRPGFTDGLWSGRTEINELLAVDTRAAASLWRFVLDIDLSPNVSWWNAPVDDPLPWLVADPRRVQRHRSDTLWLRIEDVAATLAARRYASDGALCFAVEGAAWDLVVEDGRARCAPTTRAPQLRLDRPTLGTLYLGTAPASWLARAGLIAGEPAAIACADRLFAS